MRKSMKPNATKYPAKTFFDYPERTWPQTPLTKAPIWTSVDLRDGNQALINPMNPEQRMAFYKMLVDKIGFGEVEVGFPSASTIDYDFVRTLIDGGHVPEDVTISVLTQARPELIEKTMESIKGLPKAIVHMYAATSESHRKIAFKKSLDEVIAMSVEGVRQIKDKAAENSDTKVQLEFSLEHFSATKPEEAKKVIDAVTAAWGPTQDNKIIINCPTTVENCPPDAYANMIEWISRNVNDRDKMILSVHPHNDRGCGVAATELAIRAGADRVEGCLFDGGERTGNVDLVTVGLNMYVAGLDPELDYSDIDTIAKTYVACTNMPIHPRHPYVGELVYTAFSGSHQDAIKKGMDQYVKGGVWEVPYLPIDPADVGRTYEGVIRANSLSGKAGFASAISQEMGFELPRDLQQHFAVVAQEVADRTNKEIPAQVLVKLFKGAYIEKPENGFQVVSRTLTAPFEEDNSRRVIMQIIDNKGNECVLRGQGNGPVDAISDAFGIEHAGVNHKSDTVGNNGSDSDSVDFIRFTMPSGIQFFGVGIDPDIAKAGIKATFAAINNAYAAGEIKLPEPKGPTINPRGNGTGSKIAAKYVC